MYQTPHYSSPEDKAQAYIANAVKEFTSKLTYHSRWYYSDTRDYYNTQGPIQNPTAHMALLSRLYKDGREHGFLKHYDFVAFANAIYNSKRIFHFWQRPKEIPGPKPQYWSGWGNNEPSKYVKQPYHSKKIIDEKEQARLDWRIKKKFKKDKSGRRRHRRNAPKWFCDEVCKNHRRHAKQTIRDGKWDKLFNKPYPKNANYYWW